MLESKTLLVIEDNEDVRENTAEILELANYEVLTAANGKEGVALAKKHLPDMIICDIMMPELDGYGVLHILSHNAQTAKIPFLFLTAKAEKSDFRKGMNLGADDYITKPFEEVDLLDTIHRRLEKADLITSNIDSTSASNTIFNRQNVEKHLQKLAENQKVLSVPAKHTLFYEGSYPNYLYFIESGQVKIFKTNMDGKELMTDLHQAGGYFGYKALFLDDSYAVSAITLEESRITLIPKMAFFDLLEEEPPLYRYFLQILTKKIQRREKRLLQLAYDSVRMRVASALLFCSNQGEGKDVAAQERVSIHISREDLASYVGTSKETLIRTLSDFKQEDLLITKGRYITLTNLKLLQEIAS